MRLGGRLARAGSHRCRPWLSALTGTPWARFGSAAGRAPEWTGSVPGSVGSHVRLGERFASAEPVGQASRPHLAHLPASGPYHCSALGTGRSIVGQGRSVPGAPGGLVPGPARSSARGPGPVGSRPLRSASVAARGRAALPKHGPGVRTTTTAPFTVGETGARPRRRALPDQPVPRPRSASTPPTVSRPAWAPPDRAPHQIGRLALGPRSLSGARLSGCHVHRVLVRSPPR